MPRPLRTAMLVATLTGLAACGSSPTAPPPPVPDAPTLSCPASASIESLDGAPAPFTFTVPSAVGGQTPVSVTCSRAPGSLFQLGATVVSCIATDALSRQATCNFNVTVTVTPRISKTKFLALGDSITEGRCGPKPNMCPPWTLRLDELLRGRYTRQTFVVTNRGISGERAPAGEDRLLSELNAYNPEVLLLMEGTNDLTAIPPDAAEALESLEDMIDLAKGRGITVFLATIAPVAPGGPNSAVIPLVAPFNASIRTLAARKGVPLVDVYSALNADITRYYVGDDLHPTGEGLRLIGETFYSAIRAALDTTPGGAPVSLLPQFGRR